MATSQKKIQLMVMTPNIMIYPDFNSTVKARVCTMNTGDAYTVPVKEIKTEDAAWDIEDDMRGTFGNSIYTIELPCIRDACRVNGNFAHGNNSGHGDGDKNCVGYGALDGTSVYGQPTLITTAHILNRQKGVRYHE